MLKYTIGLLLVVFSCKSVDKLDDSNIISKELEITTDDEVICDENESGSHSICRARPNEDPLEISKTQKFIVIDKNSKEVIYKDFISNGGYIKWLDDQNIEFYSSPGIVEEKTDKNDLINVYNINSNKKTSKSEYLNTIK